ALLLAAPAVWLAVPAYTSLTGTDFTLADALKEGAVLALPAFVLLASVLSALLPARVLSGFNPAQALKGKGVRNPLSGRVRALITFAQFTLSTSLIMVAFAMVLQIDHLNEMDIGFEKNDLLTFDSTYNWYEPEAFDYDALAIELARH